MFARPWLIESGRFLGVALFSLFLGFGLGYPCVSVAVGTLSVLGWHIYQLRRFEKWVRAGARVYPADISGMWGSIYSHVYRQRQRHRKRKRKLATYLKEFQESTAAMPDATVILRNGGEIEWFNDAAARVLGLRAPGDIGQRLGHLWRHPALVKFLNNHDHTPEGAIEIPARAHREIRLSVRLIDYARNRRLLMARDVTRHASGQPAAAERRTKAPPSPRSPPAAIPA